MDKVLQRPAQQAPHPAPRFTLGRAAGGGLVACLWLWTAAGALAAAAPADTAYRSALENFNRGDDTRALTLLEHAPLTGSSNEQADILNLRGAIYLRQHRYEQAQADFARARKLDSSLWAARYNEAEVSFRQKNYAESRRQFAALLEQTSRLFHNDEHNFVQYKLLLAGVCAGEDKPALDFIADHRDDAQPPLAWYYLNAALEHQHGRPQKAEQWLAQADSHFVAGTGQTYAGSFERLGWGTINRSESLAGNAARKNAHNVAIADNTVTKTPVSKPRSVSATEFASELADSRTPPPATVAVVDVVSEPGRVAFRDSSPEASGRQVDRAGNSASLFPTDFPPATDDSLASPPEAVRDTHDAVTGPVTLARTRKSHSTPAPSPSAAPDASPSGVTANQGASPTPSVGPATPPTTEFTEKYEAAYVKFLEKNYPDTLSLLDEADKIQPGQLQSISLRFKTHYALAYIEYRKQNYPGALGELDLADQAQKNADSFNLRGLIFSKQHNYDQAEAMFHKAIVTDPALWAAKFNYAELPFNRGNYTDARTRFEELFSQTDATKQPREAELTQYKVFLTLLLEGRVEAASTFMDHLNFTGATPARYFCNAALNFRAGSVDKAKNWIDDAKKEYPPQLVAIFIESFYRLGWMSDPNAPAGTLVAQATPGGTPSVDTTGPLPTTATAMPSASPAGSVAAVAPTPIVVAAASATPTPVAMATVAPRPSPAVVTASATPRPTASASPVAVLATPTASPARSVALASASPVPAASAFPLIPGATPPATPARNPISSLFSPPPAASAPPIVAATTPAASPARSVVLATVTPRPAASVPPVVVLATPTATPVHSVPSTPASTPETAQVTPAPTISASDDTAQVDEARAKKKKHRRIFVLLGLLLEIVYVLSKMRSVLLKRQQNARRAAARKRALVESSK